MNKNPDAQRLLDRNALHLRALLLGAAALIFWPDLGQPIVSLTLGVLALLNVGAWMAVFSPGSYKKRGQWFATAARLTDVAVSVSAAFWGPFQGQNVWLFAVPAILCEAVVTRSRLRGSVLAGAGMAVVLAAYIAAPTASGAPIIGAVVLAAGLGGLVLGAFQQRDEMLSLRDGRLETVLEVSSHLAGSTDLRSMMLQSLQSAVKELGASGGYIMLLDEETADELVTEVAYGVDGSFQFPERLSVGSGLSGYAVKMSQPIALRDGSPEDFDLEGVQVDARSAISIPLLARNFMGAGQSSVERAVGALTLLSSSELGLTRNEDMQVLQSIGSMLAVAVANSQMELRQRQTFLKTLESLAQALEARDTYTRGHSQRVCEVSMLIGESLGLSSEALEELRVGTILHDIGKIGVPDEILNKPGRLTDTEFEIMKSHPVIGYEICRPLMLSDGVLMIIRNHHEKLDGSGYPDGLKGGELPLSLRIVCVADAFDAMSSRRPYRDVMDMQRVLGELAKGAGSQFDSVVVETLKDLLARPVMHEIYSGQWAVPEAKSA